MKSYISVGHHTVNHYLHDFIQLISAAEYSIFFFLCVLLSNKISLLKWMEFFFFFVCPRDILTCFFLKKKNRIHIFL